MTQIEQDAAAGLWVPMHHGARWFKVCRLLPGPTREQEEESEETFDSLAGAAEPLPLLAAAVGAAAPQAAHDGSPCPVDAVARAAHALADAAQDYFAAWQARAHGRPQSQARQEAAVAQDQTQPEVRKEPSDAK